MAGALGTDVSSSKEAALSLALEAAREALTPGEHLRLLSQCQGMQPVLHGLSLPTARVPIVDFGSFFLEGMRGKSVSLTSVNESSWEAAEEAAQ